MDMSPSPPIRGTDALHPDGQYSSLAKIFHWVTVPLMAVALASGFLISFLTDRDNGVYKMAGYAIHESAGLTIMGLAILRLLWRGISRPPASPPHMPPLMRKVAAGVHHALYAMLILQPLLGFFATNAWGFPMQGATAYLGLIDLPKFMETQETLAKILSGLHTLGGYFTGLLVLAHVGGAIFHHAVRRDGTLLRML